jgi:hypothetical protein
MKVKIRMTNLCDDTPPNGQYHITIIYCRQSIYEWTNQKEEQISIT